MIDHSIRPHDQLVPSSETYADHFGLRVEAFSAAADAISFYRSASYAEALATLHLAVRNRRGLALLVGDAGTGKTTVARHLCEELQVPFCVSYVSNNRYPFSELLQRAALGFGIDPVDGDGTLDLQARLAAVLHEQAVDGMAFVLVIDEAQDLDDDALQRLRLLSNDEAAVPLQIVLVGQPALARRLVRPHLRAVANRVTSRSVVGRLSRQESIRYVGARLECAGGKASIFTDTALQLIARRCGGNPRTISVVCHTAMLLARSEGASRVSAAMVAHALRSRLARSPGQRWDEVRGWPSRVIDTIGLRAAPGWATGASLVAAGAVVILAMRGLGPSAATAPPSGREELVDALAEVGAPVHPLGSGDDLPQDTALAADTLAEPPTSEGPPAEAPPAAAAFDPGAGPASLTDPGRVVNVPDSRPAGGPLVPATSADAPDAAARVTPVRAANLREEGAPRSVRPRAVPQHLDADRNRAGADSPDVREIRVRPGRGLRAMARDVYGDDSPAVIARLKRANPQITDVNLIRAGDLLRFPDLTEDR